MSNSHTETRTAFDLALDNAVSHPSTMPVVYLGPHRLRRTKIPADIRVVRKFDIDSDTDLQMSVIAMRKGLTIDELYRLLAWTYLNHQG